MMKKLLFLTICLLLIVTVGANAQWKFVKYFPADTVKYPFNKWSGGVNGGLAVDKEGKIWIQSYGGAVDSILNASGKYQACGAINVFYPNGTPASFSPIKVLTGKDLTGATVTDTLGGSGYGMAMDPSTGNMLSTKTSTRLWKIDYKTGKGILRVISPIPGYTSSFGQVAVDNFGEIFIGPVVPPAAVAILNSDFTASGTVLTATSAYQRTIAVSSDGNDVYVPGYTALKTWVYHSDNGSLGPYVLKDSIGVGLCTETMIWHPKTGDLWMGSGSTGGGVPNGPYVAYRWYDYSFKTKKIVDSIVWAGDVSNDPRPRGIAFNANGDTAYVAAFGGNSGWYGGFVQVFAKSGATSVEQDKNVIPTGYTLSQNYPNPFNPSTQIRFTITQTGMTSLKVYDVMGREVATLVDESMSPGAYTVKFDASHLSSGTYMYVLTSGSARLTNKMMLVK